MLPTAMAWRRGNRSACVFAMRIVRVAHDSVPVRLRRVSPSRPKKRARRRRARNETGTRARNGHAEFDFGQVLARHDIKGAEGTVDLAGLHALAGVYRAPARVILPLQRYVQERLELEPVDCGGLAVAPVDGVLLELAHVPLFLVVHRKLVFDDMPFVDAAVGRAINSSADVPLARFAALSRPLGGVGVVRRASRLSRTLIWVGSTGRGVTIRDHDP